MGATILPFAGALDYSADKENVREAINEWIRTSATFDNVIDFDVSLHDPTQPGKLKAERNRARSRARQAYANYETADHFRWSSCRRWREN